MNSYVPPESLRAGGLPADGGDYGPPDSDDVLREMKREMDTAGRALSPLQQFVRKCGCGEHPLGCIVGTPAAEECARAEKALSHPDAGESASE